jgi:hypothetical protein
MAQNHDVSLKALFLREGDGIIRRRLFGGRVTEHLATEQPQVSNHRADMVVRNEAGELHHVEFQSANETNFGLRMAEYYIHLVGRHQQEIIQTVLYLGRDPLRMAPGYTSAYMDFHFEIVDLRELDAAPLLQSDDWADIALALLANGDKQAALDVAVSRLRAMQREDRAWASGILLLLSGILKIEETVNEKIKEAGMINLLENKVLGPMILQAEETGRIKGMEQGIEQGIEQGMNTLLQELLTEKFGVLPEWTIQRLQTASADQLHAWAKRLLHEDTLESILR